MLYTEYKTSRHSLQKPNIRTVLSNSEQCKSEEYLNNNSYICLDLLQALLHRADRYFYKMNLLRWTPPCLCLLGFFKRSYNKNWAHFRLVANFSLNAGNSYLCTVQFCILSRIILEYKFHIH